MDDPVYPGTRVLINHFNERNQDALTLLESKITSLRLLELIKSPIEGVFDLHHMKAIHYHIFKDIYPFAGKVRAVPLAKQNSVFFFPLILKATPHRSVGPSRKTIFYRD